ncbi:MAG: Ig-like domain-containing protein [Methanomassiliicoccales archaeon]|jgi:hypothetical protein|nr:Ig-like domain-containing protein [Methanomassiliicoccales archaeon]
MNSTKILVAMFFTFLLVVSFGLPAIAGAVPQEGERVRLVGKGVYGADVAVNDTYHPGHWIWAWAGYYLLENDTGTGVEYNGYCIDFNMVIDVDDILWADGDLTNFLTENESCAVNYIISMFKPEMASDPNLEAAAIQCAIWHIVTLDENDTFMMDDATGPRYDGWNESYGDAIRVRALEIVGSIPEPCSYPSSLQLEPEVQCIDCDDLAAITATVLDQYGNPMENVLVRFSTTSGVLSDDEVLTNSTGEAVVYLDLNGSTMAVVTACINGGEGILIWDDANPPNTNYPTVDVQNLVVPNEICDSSIVKCCYYPDGFTIGFWKTNIGKNWGWMKGSGIQVPKAKIVSYLEEINDIFDGQTGHCKARCMEWIRNITPSQAYNILSIPNANNMMQKAQAQILALLLTNAWYNDYFGPDYYLKGCVDLPGDDDMTIGDALHQILDWYCSGKYEKAKNLADYINNQPEGGYY